jgi:protein-disulfide isomerase-like protein with CxxC motif
MNLAYISAISALGGSVVGGLISGVATWLAQREQAVAGKRAHDRAWLEDLYRDFMLAASKAIGEALTSNDPKIEDIVALYALVSRMRVRSSPQIVACADNVMRIILDTYFAPNKTISELHDVIEKRGQGLDVLREFSELAREELQTF